LKIFWGKETMKSFQTVVILMVAITLWGCERGADVSSPAQYNKSGISFSYPGNWEVVEDVEESDFRYLTVESPGDAIFIIAVYQKQDALPLKDYVKEFSAMTREEMPIGDIGESSFASINKLAVPNSKEGIQEKVPMRLLGVEVPHVREYYLVESGDKVAFLISQVATEDLGHVEPGFKLIFDKFKIL